MKKRAWIYSLISPHIKWWIRALFFEFNVPKFKPLFFKKRGHDFGNGLTDSQTQILGLSFIIKYISLHNLKERSPALQVKYTILSRELQVLFYNKLCFLCVLSPIIPVLPTHLYNAGIEKCKKSMFDVFCLSVGLSSRCSFLLIFAALAFLRSRILISENVTQSRI